MEIIKSIQYIIDNYHNRHIIRRAETIGQFSLMKTNDALQAPELLFRHNRRGEKIE